MDVEESTRLCVVLCVYLYTLLGVVDRGSGVRVWETGS